MIPDTYPSVRDSLEDRVAGLSGVECSALGVTSWVLDNDECRNLASEKERQDKIRFADQSIVIGGAKVP